MGTRSRTPLALGAVVLLLCAVVAATSTPARWTGVELPWSGPAQAAEDTDDAPKAEDAAGARDDGEASDGAQRVVPVGVRGVSRAVLAAGLLLAAGAVVLAVLRYRLVRRRRLLAGDATERSGAALRAAEEPGADEADDLAAALDAGRRALDTGTPRNAIVATWLRLEEAVTTERFPRQAAETPTELVARALSAYRLDPEVIHRLAELYEEARFSRHAVTEAHRREAGECLTRLTASLRSRHEEVSR